MMRTFVIFAGLVLVGCAMPASHAPANQSVYTNIGVSRTRGQLGKHFSAQVWVRSNYVQRAEYTLMNGTKLPPGVTLNPQTGMIEGVPTQSGFWTVCIGVRDVDRGTHDYPGSSPKYWYCQNVELKIFDELRNET